MVIENLNTTMSFADVVARDQTLKKYYRNFLRKWHTRPNNATWDEDQAMANLNIYEQHTTKACDEDVISQALAAL